jgi:hypothetical protein
MILFNFVLGDFAQQISKEIKKMKEPVPVFAHCNENTKTVHTPQNQQCVGVLQVKQQIGLIQLLSNTNHLWCIKRKKKNT